MKRCEEKEEEMNDKTEAPIDRAEREIRTYVETVADGIPVIRLDDRDRRELALRTGLPTWVVHLMNPKVRKETPFREVQRAGEALRGAPA